MSFTPPVTHTANDMLHIVKRVGDYLDEAVPWETEDHDTDEELVKLHVAITELRALLKNLCQNVDTALHNNMTKDREEIAGYQIERRGPSYHNTWDVPLALQEVSIAALVSEDGEIRHESPIEAANTVANAILKTAGISYMRVMEGDKLGIDLRKFRDRGQMTSPAGVILRAKPKEE